MKLLTPICFFLLVTNSNANTLEIVNNNSTLSLVAEDLSISIAGDNNTITIRGDVDKVTVSGKNNVIDISELKSIVCTGDQNIVLLPTAVTQVNNIGTSNRFHYRLFEPLDIDI